MSQPCSIRENFEIEIARVYEKLAEAKVESPAAGVAAERKLGQLLSRKHAHCGKHGCLRNVHPEATELEAD